MSGKRSGRAPARWGVRAGLAGAIAALGVAGAAAGLAPGDRVEPFRLEDQHGVPHEVDATRRAVLLTRDMDGGGHVREALAEGGAERLARAGAVYVADVSRMPALVRRLLAEPRMRGRPYPILLDRTGEVSAAWPGQAGRVTLVVLDRLEVRAVHSLDTAEAVRSALDELAGASPQAGARPPEP